MQTILKAIIRSYQLCISPFLPMSCRFHPTCSAYTLGAIERYGARIGMTMGLKRLCKCHPFYKGDIIDPVPEKDDNNTLPRID